jgi:hypothetical protein
MADTSLWPVVVGGLLGVGGTMVGVIGTTIRDVAQQRHEKAKRRADKFEELVAAVYEFDHWLSSMRERDAFGVSPDIPVTVSPFAKVQSISSVYFQQFSELVRELEIASDQYRIWMYQAEGRRVSKNAQYADGFSEAYGPYVQKREALLDALKKFAREEFQ